MLKTVIFDFDGVIVDSEKIVRQGWQYAAQQMGLGEVDHLFLQCVGVNHIFTEHLLAQQFGAAFSYETFRNHTRGFFHNYTAQHGLPVKLGAQELLSFLKDQDCQIGLASSSTLQYILKGLQQAEFTHYFSAIVSGENLQRSKPEPDIYIMACEKLGVAAEEAYAIEDSYNGIRSASSAKTHPIMVPDLLPVTEEMRQLSAVICSNLLEVKKYLQDQSLS